MRPAVNTHELAAGIDIESDVELVFWAIDFAYLLRDSEGLPGAEELAVLLVRKGASKFGYVAMIDPDDPNAFNDPLSDMLWEMAQQMSDPWFWIWSVPSHMRPDFPGNREIHQSPSHEGSELVRGGDFGSGALAHWDHRAAESGLASFGQIGAPANSNNGRFAFTTTGPWSANDLGYMEQTIQVTQPRTANFEMAYNFATMEYPHWVGSSYNDTFEATLTGPGGVVKFATRESVNESMLIGALNLPLEGRESDAGGHTGWIHVTSQNIALSPGQYQLRIEVRDQGDRIVDSAILVDRASLR